MPSFRSPCLTKRLSVRITTYLSFLLYTFNRSKPARKMKFLYQIFLPIGFILNLHGSNKSETSSSARKKNKKKKVEKQAQTHEIDTSTSAILRAIYKRQRLFSLMHTPALVLSRFTGKLSLFFPLCLRRSCHLKPWLSFYGGIHRHYHLYNYRIRGHAPLNCLRSLGGTALY